MKRLWPPLALLAAAVGVWEALVRVENVHEYLLPAPSAVGQALSRDRGLLTDAALVTAKEIVLGFGLAVGIGLAVAVLLHASPVLRRAALPLLVLSQTVPTVVFAPLLAIGLGYGLAPKLLVVGVVCFFPVVVNAVHGLGAADPELVRMMRTLHAGRGAIFRRVELPGALPSILTGARIAATYAAVGAVFAEWAGSSSGLGFVMLQAQPSLETARIFAAVVVLTAMALALYGSVVLAEHVLVPWNRKVSHA